jgi:hypothetical protein
VIVSSNYEQLVREFCSRAGLNDYRLMAEGEPLNIDGEKCWVKSAAKDGDEMVLHLEFGVVPPGGQALQVLQELLVQNYLGAPTRGVTYGLLSPTERNVVVASVRLDASETSPDNLLGLMHQIGNGAKRWRKSHFLERADRNAGMTTAVTAKALPMVTSRTRVRDAERAPRFPKT